MDRGHPGQKRAVGKKESGMSDIKGGVRGIQQSLTRHMQSAASSLQTVAKGFTELNSRLRKVEQHKTPLCTQAHPNEQAETRSASSVQYEIDSTTNRLAELYSLRRKLDPEEDCISFACTVLPPNAPASHLTPCKGFITGTKDSRLVKEFGALYHAANGTKEIPIVSLTSGQSTCVQDSNKRTKNPNVKQVYHKFDTIKEAWV
jgi:hypothetical protein